MQRRIATFLIFAALAIPAWGQPPITAEQIMSRVAANQDESVQSRSQFVYKQHIHTTSHLTNGKLMREEVKDVDVFPTPKGSERKLLSLVGTYRTKGKLVEFSGEPVPEENSLDAELTHNILEDSDGHSGKEGYLSNLFPLTTRKQQQYTFKLLGEEVLHGRAAYHIAFEPKDKTDIDWSGEAFIDKEEFEPVHVFTKLSRKLPFLARSVLGVNLPGIGFNVQYTRREAGVWFPETFGTEFELHLFHLRKRRIAISLKNSDFEKTHADTSITVPNGTQ
jgi:hypothetical protein